MRNILQLVKLLTEAGINGTLAQAIATEIGSVNGTYATTEGLEKVRTELKQEIEKVRTEVQEVRTELKQDIREVRTELKQDIQEVRTEIKGVRTELKQDIQEVRSEVKEVRFELHAGLHRERWFIMGLMTVLISIATAVIKLL